MSDADLHRDIESTREALGDTVEALARKADVKARVEDKIDERKAQARQSVDDVRAQVGRQAERLQSPPGRYIALAVLAVVVLVGLARRRRRR